MTTYRDLSGNRPNGVPVTEDHVPHLPVTVTHCPVIACLGDSITAQGSLNTDTSQSYNNYGYFTWLRILSLQRVHIPVTHNFGVSGERLDQIRLRVNDVINADPKPHYCIVLAGTNDVGTRTVQDMVTDMKAILAKLITYGIRPIVMPILPRSDLVTSQLQKLMRFDTWLREYVRTQEWIIFVDPTQAWIDYANTDGDPRTDFTQDGLHPTQTGAYVIGKALADALEPLIPEQHFYVQHVLDIYDASNNPEGNLLTNGTLNYGIMQGTSGTKTASTGFTPSGNVATGWTLSRSNATSTMTAVASKEDPRTDGPATGARQKVVIASTVAGGANELVLLTPTFTQGNVVAGDVVYAEAKFEISGMTKVMSVELRLTDTRTGDSQNNHDGAWSSYTVYLEDATDSIIGVLKTHPLTIRSDHSSLTCNIAVRLDNTAGDAGATIYISDVSLRKVGTLS